MDKKLEKRSSLSPMGFTILEVLVALSILIIILPSISNLLNTIIKKSNSIETTVAILMVDKIEELKSKGFTNINNSSGCATTNNCTISWQIIKQINSAQIIVNGTFILENKATLNSIQTIIIPK